MAHDLTAFEGDWWLLIEEQALDHTPRQRWTLRDDRVLHMGDDVGSCRVDGAYLVIDAERMPMRFLTDDALAPGYLQGNIEHERLPAYCTFIRVHETDVSQDR